MVIHFDPTLIDCSSCKQIMSHVRGRLRNATLQEFMLTEATMEVPYGSPPAVCISISAHALVWHNQSIEQICECIRQSTSPTRLDVVGDDQKLLIKVPLLFTEKFGVLRSRTRITDPAHLWEPLPMDCLDEILRNAGDLPGVADVFCAHSGAIHNQLSLCQVDRKQADTIVSWIRKVISDCEAATGNDVPCNERSQSIHSFLEGGVGRGGNIGVSRERKRQSSPIRRKRGARRWVTSVCTVPDEGEIEEEAVADTTTAPPLLTSYLIPLPLDVPQIPSAKAPITVIQMIHWFAQSVILISGIDNTMVPLCIREWVKPTLSGIIRQPEQLLRDCPFLQSVFVLVVGVLQNTTSQGLRTEKLQGLFNAAVWCCTAPLFTPAYIRNSLIPELVSLHICGLEGIREVIVHRDDTNDEWYVSTEGSNLKSLYAQYSTIMIDRRRCMSTDIVEMQECFGLEAICWMFSPPHVCSHHTIFMWPFEWKFSTVVGYQRTKHGLNKYTVFCLPMHHVGCWLITWLVVVPGEELIVPVYCLQRVFSIILPSRILSLMSLDFFLFFRGCFFSCLHTHTERTSNQHQTPSECGVCGNARFNTWQFSKNINWK